jgi:hypothetical protein
MFHATRIDYLRQLRNRVDRRETFLREPTVYPEELVIRELRMIRDTCCRIELAPPVGLEPTRLSAPD